MNHPGGNMNHGPCQDRMLNPPHGDRSRPGQNVIQFGRTLVKVRARAVDVDRVRPGRWELLGIFATDQSVPPAARTSLARGIPFVSHQNSARRRLPQNIGFRVVRKYIPEFPPSLILISAR